MKIVNIATVLLDLAALGVLAAVPLSGPLGWSDAEVPASAIGGMLYVGIPLCLALAAIVVELRRKTPLRESVLASAAFWACVFVAVLAAWMAVQSSLEPVNVSMRGMSLIMVALFLLNALVLRRSAFVRRTPDAVT